MFILDTNCAGEHGSDTPEEHTDAAVSQDAGPEVVEHHTPTAGQAFELWPRFVDIEQPKTAKAKRQGPEGHRDGIIRYQYSSNLIDDDDRSIFPAKEALGFPRGPEPQANHSYQHHPVEQDGQGGQEQKKPETDE